MNGLIFKGNGFLQCGCDPLSIFRFHKKNGSHPQPATTNYNPMNIYS
jgi:hypothetical protein